MSRLFQFSLKALLTLSAIVAAFFGGIRFERDQRTRVDRERQAVQWHEKALLDYQESLRDYANHLRDPSGKALLLPYGDGWRPHPETGLPLPPSPETLESQSAGETNCLLFEHGPRRKVP